MPAMTTAPPYAPRSASDGEFSRLVLGPLAETTWSPPASCTQILAACDTCDYGWRAQVCADEGIATDDQACWPPTTAGVPKTSQGLNGWGVYSPALACPTGYTSAAQSIYGRNANNKFQYPLTAGETAVGCCPEARDGEPAYSMSTAYGFQTCIQVATEGSFNTGSCQARDAMSTATAALPMTLGQSPKQTTVKAFAVFAPLFQLVHHSSDVPGYMASSSTESLRPPTAAASAAGGQSNTAAGTSGGLSSAAQAGIAVGVVLLGIMLGVVGFWLWRKRHERKAQNKAEISAAAMLAHASDPAREKELHRQGDTWESTYKQPQVSMTWLHGGSEGGYYSELSSVMDPRELHHVERPVELAAGSSQESLAHSLPTYQRGRRH